MVKGARYRIVFKGAYVYVPCAFFDNSLNDNVKRDGS